MIVCAAHLNAIDTSAAVAARIEAPADTRTSRSSAASRFHARQLARDRLEVDIVLEQDARNLAELTRILPHRHVLELQHVDVLQQNLTMDQPFEVAIAELRHRMRMQRIRTNAHGPSCERQTPPTRIARQLSCAARCVLKIEQHDQVQSRESRQLGRRLIHEHAAAVSRRADRIRRDEQNGQLVGRTASAWNRSRK